MQLIRSNGIAYFPELLDPNFGYEVRGTHYTCLIQQVASYVIKKGILPEEQVKRILQSGRMREGVLHHILDVFGLESKVVVHKSIEDIQKTVLAGEAPILALSTDLVPFSEYLQEDGTPLSLCDTYPYEDPWDSIHSYLIVGFDDKSLIIRENRPTYTTYNGFLRLPYSFLNKCKFGWRALELVNCRKKIR